jgi:hypothetical protein
MALAFYASVMDEIDPGITSEDVMSARHYRKAFTFESQPNSLLVGPTAVFGSALGQATLLAKHGCIVSSASFFLSDFSVISVAFISQKRSVICFSSLLFQRLNPFERCT